MRPPSRWKYIRNLTVFTLVVLVLALTGSLAYLGHRSVQGYLHPPRFTPPRPAGAAYQEVALATTDGVELAAWYAPPENGTVILVAHGFGGARSAEMFTFFTSLGFGVLAWDFRAHGESGGEFATLGYQEALDVEAALDFALQQPGVRAVGAYGESMGATAVIHAAARRPEIGAVVVDSPFTGLDEQLQFTISSPLLRPFIRLMAELETGIRFRDHRPLDQIGNISPRPVFIIQGLADNSVAPDSAEALYQAAGEPRRLWTEPQVGHVGMRPAFPEEYARQVERFFREALGGEGSPGARGMGTASYLRRDVRINSCRGDGHGVVFAPGCTNQFLPRGWARRRICTGACESIPAVQGTAS